MPPVQQWLVIQQIEVRRPAGHEQVNDALRLRSDMRVPENAAIGAGISGQTFTSKQLIQCKPSKTHAEMVQQRATGKR